MIYNDIFPTFGSVVKFTIYAIRLTRVIEIVKCRYKYPLRKNVHAYYVKSRIAISYHKRDGNIGNWVKFTRNVIRSYIK